MPRSTPPPPLDADRLRALALRYVGRYATTAARLRRYLDRKLRERGSAGDAPLEVAALVDRIVALGYVDDRAFGEMRSQGLAARGYGPRRVAQTLAAAGLDREAAAEIGDAVDPHAAATRYAQRRRFGPWDSAAADPDRQRKQFAAMLRAGHSSKIIKAVFARDVPDDDDMR